ncbi:hypothetical protein LDG_5072 [Legionella drancourtii LLAP12]|uniref:Uncharacterized protein n=1 Tax=Legionella drancourtii LLAP12 TaxID=658187 RepID=G9EIR6_9GAMM|nr:hypothetical protein LDG_5072 [Legionella drancourtii LLAP12]
MSCLYFKITETELAQVFTAIPESVTSLNLSNNSLQKFSENL